MGTVQRPTQTAIQETSSNYLEAFDARMETGKKGSLYLFFVVQGTHGRGPGGRSLRSELLRGHFYSRSKGILLCHAKITIGDEMVVFAAEIRIPLDLFICSCTVDHLPLFQTVENA